MQTLNDEVLQSVILNNDEKQSLVSEIALMTSLVDWMEQKNEESQWVKEKNNIVNGAQDVQTGDSNSLGWWDSWGKCAAGIVGNAGLGFLAGGAAGSAFPLVGNIGGAIIGTIFGGITGGAAVC